MLFNSLEFLLFFALFIAIWPLARQARNVRWAYLAAASFFFYGWWDWRFLFLLIGTGLIDYLAALGIVAWPRWRKPLLVASLVGNLGTLALFKYLDFGLSNLNAMFGLLGSDWRVPLAHVTLPVGISFYTFQSLSYTIDVYRGELKPTRNILHFFAFLSMFPQLVAGPIIRAADLLPQLETVKKTTEAQRWDGLRLVLFGYFKKVVIADNLAAVADIAFGSGNAMPGSCWWVASAVFACQIYCDFSGYSDIARGLARWLGYDFMVNFDHPYIATSFREFWTRWHISLSTWFRDYVYIPLGGARRGPGRAYVNLWITMLLSGLWHGAAWTFVGWSVLHAAFLSVERATHLPRRLAALPGGRLMSWAIVMAGVLVAWVFFRAESLAQAVSVTLAMFSPSALDLAAIRQHFHWQDLLLVGLVAARQAYVFASQNRRPTTRPSDDNALPTWTARLSGPVVLAALLWACVYLRGPGHAFVYFQF